MRVVHSDRWLPCPIGGRHLSGDEIVAILYLFGEGYSTRYGLAKTYGCSWKHIDNIVKRKYKFTQQYTGR